MAKRLLDSGAVSAFCESMSFMLAAGIQTEEAVHLLSESEQAGAFRTACHDMYESLTSGTGLSRAMEASAAFPHYAVEMVAIGEGSGHLEDVLRSLSVYYDEEARLVNKVRSSIGYPAALLCVMCVILGFTVGAILPVFNGVYSSVLGSLTATSFQLAAASGPIAWVALVITAVCAVVALACFVMVRNESGRERLMHAMEHLPVARKAMARLALSRFTSVLAVYLAAGYDTDHAMKAALDTVDHGELAEKGRQAYEAMVDPTRASSLVQAIVEVEMLEPIYARMLTAGARVGRIDEVLDRLSGVFFDDAVDRMDRLIDTLEPVLAAFMTIAVGATLVAVMLPLVGIMGSMG